MNKQQRIQAFVALGNELRKFCMTNSDYELFNAAENERLYHAVLRAKAENGWFPLEAQHESIRAWAELLSQESLHQFADNYAVANDFTSKKIGLILAGNLPLVGFHDVLSVLLSGHVAYIKPSSQDAVLTKAVLHELTTLAPEFLGQIQFVEQLKTVDAIIATGSNNSARYFEHYFGKFPNIIRKNRTSVAVLTGTESEHELKALGKDIFTYYGLGCRNVAKLFVPKGYDFSKFFESIFSFGESIMQHTKYMNNYDYQKAIFLMNGDKLLDNNFLILKQSDLLHSPVGVLFYEEYSSLSTVNITLKELSNEIQCVVSNNVDISKIKLGGAQNPSLLDYADCVDTMQFLSNL